MPDNNLTTKETVRYLRKNQTKAEHIMWQALRNWKLNGYKFIRQYPIIIDNGAVAKYQKILQRHFLALFTIKYFQLAEASWKYFIAKMTQKHVPDLIRDYSP